MKTLITNYTYDPGFPKITFNDFYHPVINPSGPVLEIERMLVITNLTNGQMIYNFASAAKGGTVTNNDLILEYTDFPFASTDKLQIWYDNELTPASDQVAEALFEVARKLDFLNAVRGVSADLRVSPLSTPNMSALTTLSNLAGLSGWGTGSLVKDFDNLTAINSNINNVA
jgi:hypothetical protein